MLVTNVLTSTLCEVCCLISNQYHGRTGKIAKTALGVKDIMESFASKSFVNKNVASAFEHFATVSGKPGPSLRVNIFRKTPCIMLARSGILVVVRVVEPDLK